MHLTREEESALNGESGIGIQTAMGLLIDVGEFYDADRLIPIESTHISGVSYLTGGDGLVDILDFFVEKGAKTKVYSTLNPSGMDRDNWESHFIDLDFATKQLRILRNFEAMGVSTTCSCTPYDFGHILTKGQHVAWAESSAITFANSFFGARTNKEDSLTVLSASITGKTINYGFHLSENRIPNVLVNNESSLKEYADYSILGEIVGKEFNHLPFKFGAIPLFKGIKTPRPFEMKGLGAALASFGTHLFHIENITPEIELYKNLKYSDFQEEITVTDDMIEEMYESFKPPEDSQIAVIGCPNASYEEILEIVELTKGKKVIQNKEFWLFTNRAQRALAESSNIIEELQERGIKILVDTCPEVTPYDKSRFSSVLTNSVKAQHYISAPSLNNLPTYILPIRRIVEVMFE